MGKSAYNAKKTKTNDVQKIPKSKVEVLVNSGNSAVSLFY